MQFFSNERRQKWRSLLVRIAAALTFTMGSIAVAIAAPSAESTVSTWVQKNLHPVGHVSPMEKDDFRDLEPLRAMIGEARIVSLGEGMHGVAEPLEFRNRLFRFLVQRMGFTAIAIESGIAEGFEVNNYVLGGTDDLAGVAQRGFSFGFARLPQEADLMRWMRSYNDDPKTSRKIEFYGVDVSGNETDMTLPLQIALDYLKKRDTNKADAFRARVANLLPYLKLDRIKEASNQYTELTQADRDRMTSTVADIIAEFEIHETQWTAATSRREYAVAYRAAISARQVDSYLRWIPIGWKPKDGYAGMYPTVASADHTKAENLEWVLQQMAPNARILVFMHRGHLMYTPSRIHLPPPVGTVTLPPMVGMYMKQRYGRENFMLAHLFAEIPAQCGRPSIAPPPGTVEALFSAVEKPSFLLDLRSAPRDVTDWLKVDRDEFGAPPLNTISVGNAYDALFFTRSVSPVLPCP